MIYRKTAPLVVALLFLSQQAFAAAATLSGRVVDPNGRAIAGAEVELRNPQTGAVLFAQTNDEGLYIIPEIPPGRYELKVSRVGFQSLVKKNLTVNVGAKLAENVTLQVGALTEEVMVEADALPLEKDSAAVSTVINRAFVENLPLNGRSFQTLIELAPGVVVARPTIFAPGQFSVNGQRTNTNYFMVDGVSANFGASFTAQSFQQSAGTLPALTVLGGTNGLVSVDALQEFRIQTSTYAPEFGRTPGAQISLVTRSGTNSLTWTAFNYFRNEALDANDWFNNSTFNPATGRFGIPKQPLRQNNFGVTVGGPLFLPRFGEGGPLFFDGRNRSFFFFSYEGLRLREPQPGTRSFRVPTLEARRTAAPSVRPVLDAFPLPNAPRLSGDPPNVGRYIVTYSYPSRFDALSLRVDQRVGNRANIFGRFARTPSSRDERAFANGQNRFELNTMMLTIGATWTISPRVVNEIRVNRSTSRGMFTFSGLEIDGARLPPDSLIFPSFAPRATTSASLQIGTPSEPVSVTQGKSLGNKQRQWNVVDSLTWITGAHELKFGVDYRRLSPIVDARSIGISYNFFDPVQRTFRTDGFVSSVQIQALAPVSQFYFHNISFYAQDTWRATPKLTFNYGARYEINPPLSGERLPYTIEGLENPLTARLAPPNTRQYRTTYDNIAPRLGLAYLVSEARGLVVRAGAGVFYDVGNGSLLRGYSSFPYNTTRTITNAPFPVPESLLQPPPFNADPPYSATFEVFDPNLKLPYTVQYSATAEKRFGNNQSLSVAYVAARGRRLLRREILRNQPARRLTDADGRVIEVPAITVLNPSLWTTSSTVFVTRNASRSDYDSLQLQFQRRLSRGLQAVASYTLGRSTDDISTETVATFPASGAVGPIRVDLAGERGPSDFDIRHNFIAAATYDLPSFASGKRFGWLLSGWGVDLITRARSAPPLTVITQSVDPLVFAGTRRVNRREGVPIYIQDPTAPGGRRLNRAAFAEPPVGTQGDLRRNSLRGFPFYQTDISLRRQIRVGERWRVQLRADLFNAFNRPNFADPVATYNFPEPQFGRPTQMLNRQLGGASGTFNPLYQIGGPRSVQLSVKFIY